MIRGNRANPKPARADVLPRVINALALRAVGESRHIAASALGHFAFVPPRPGEPP